MWDVVTLGETMLRLTPPNLLRLEQTRSLEIEVGGSESNTAIGLSRLGARTLWISRLSSNPLGRKIAREISSFGVDTSSVVWTEDDRVGLYFFEEGKAPRGSSVIYDRRHSAVSRMTPEELPRDVFAAGKGKLLHLTGITLALSESARRTADEAVRRAKNANWRFSFDLNFRSKLWSSQAAQNAYENFLHQTDLIFAPLGDVKAIYGDAAGSTAQSAIAFLRQEFPQASIVVTAGADGSFARGANGELIFQPCYPADTVGRLGGGDAFAAGFLFAYYLNPASTGDLAAALKWASAAAALKYATPGDIPLFTKREVEALVAEETSGKLVR